MLKRIYVALLGEGTDVLMPVQALQKSENTFLIVEIENFDVEDDYVWEFNIGDTVTCAEKQLSSGLVTVAVAKLG